MATTRKQKEKILEDLKGLFSLQKAIVLVGITGLKVKDLSLLRKKIKSINGNLKVAKKTLIEIICKENGLDFDKRRFKDEMALVFGFQDETLPAKTVYEFFKGNEKLKILGGYFNNNFKEAEEVITLAQLPSREELMAKLVWSLESPISNFVNVLEGNIKGLIFALSAIKK